MPDCMPAPQMARDGRAVEWIGSGRSFVLYAWHGGQYITGQAWAHGEGGNSRGHFLWSVDGDLSAETWQRVAAWLRGET
jgi:hypothetical protein